MIIRWIGNEGSHEEGLSVGEGLSGAATSSTNSHNVDHAIDWLVAAHVRLATTTGFVTGLGGLTTFP